MGTRRLTLFASLVLLLLLNASRPVFPWGAFRGVQGIKITDTHQQILRAAFDLLMSDPRFAGLNGLPAAGGRVVPFESIVAFEGVNGEISTLTPYGPGPDADGATPYSQHWFNPATGQGGGPQAAYDWYQAFLKAVLGIEGGDAETCKGLAWSAHFLADMLVPYHLIGMPAGDALARIASRNFILGPNESGPAYFIDPAPPAPQPDNGGLYRSAGQAVTAWWRDGWGPNGDFRNAFAVFSSNHQAVGAAHPQFNFLDWFDPWYWNGDGSRSVFSSHATYESIAHGRFVQAGGYRHKLSDPPAPYDPLWQNAIPDYAFAGTAWQSQAWQVQDYAARLASRTLQNADLCWRQPEVAIRTDVLAVYSLWRSAYSALQPLIRAGRDPARPNAALLVQVNVVSHALEPCHNVSVRMTIRRGGAIISEWTQTIEGLVTQEGGGQTGWSAPVDPNEEWDVVAEVVGVYDKTPDLQYSMGYALYRPDPRDPVQQFFERPRPVEEARVEDFAGEYSIGDPQRSTGEYSGTLTLSPNGVATAVEFVSGQRIEGKGEWYFDRQNLYFSLKAMDGGEFAGTIRGTTADFTVTGHWNNGTPGTLHVYRRR